MKHKFIIFDWDGTLMDSIGRIVNCMQLVAEDLALNVPTSNEVKGIIGISLKPGIKKLFPDVSDEYVEKLFNGYKEHYLRLDNTPSPMFDGVEDMLEDLRSQGHQLAVATGKARRGLVRAWEHTGLSHYFVASRCADETLSKPNPDMLQQLLKESRFDIEDAVMIGDSIHDLKMAESIGMDRIGVSFGAATQEALEEYQPLTVSHDIPQLNNFIQAFNS
ncbi:HAD-IIIA family hydrolase [Alteromonadaceae bacterium M269]|nr:HAD-IIIA family hydrolase [Alteromonadaceae bacterium M269]